MSELVHVYTLKSGMYARIVRMNTIYFSPEYLMTDSWNNRDGTEISNFIFSGF